MLSGCCAPMKPSVSEVARCALSLAVGAAPSDSAPAAQRDQQRSPPDGRPFSVSLPPSLTLFRL
jgi:hypothetical protein